MQDTFNITVKCDSEEDRDIVLEALCPLMDKGIVRFQKDIVGNPNVFFSENDMVYINEKLREVN